MTIGEAITKDLQDVLGRIPKEVLTDVGREYKESIWETSNKAKQPDGSLRAKLASDKYKKRKQKLTGSTTRDFFYTGTAKSSFYYQEGENEVSFDYNDSKAYEYMRGHEDKGDGHRLYPIESDSQSSEQKEVLQYVENRILDTLTQPRTIRASATTVVR